VIYQAGGDDDPIDQADIIEGCPLLGLKELQFDALSPPKINVTISRVLVLTQTCDLVNRKISSVTVATVHDAQVLVTENLLKPADIKGPIRAGRVFGWSFLPASAQLGLPEMIVDLRQLHTVRYDLLTNLCQRGRRCARILSPYREHLAKHFADTFSRIGLPEAYRFLGEIASRVLPKMLEHRHPEEVGQPGCAQGHLRRPA
jgi:hypothetical protein